MLVLIGGPSDCLRAVNTDGRLADNSSRAQTTDVVTALDIRSKALIFAKIYAPTRPQTTELVTARPSAEPQTTDVVTALRQSDPLFEPALRLRRCKPISPPT